MEGQKKSAAQQQQIDKAGGEGVHLLFGAALGEDNSERTVVEGGGRWMVVWKMTVPLGRTCDLKLWSIG